MDYEKRTKRKRDVAARARSGKADYASCRIIGCKRPTTAAAGKGLDRLYCRSHADRYDRHGSYLKGTYTAAQLEPHRKAAGAWLKAHMGDEVVQRAIRAIETLYRNAGPHLDAFRLRGLSPAERAKAAWARLRTAGIEPTRPLEAWLAIKGVIAADTQREDKVEYRRVQAAKLVHRMASGSHKRWQWERPKGGVVVKELHRYPLSRGLVLRHIGEQLERAVELAADRYTPSVPVQKPATNLKTTHRATTSAAAKPGSKVTEVTLTRTDGQVVRFTRTDN